MNLSAKEKSVFTFLVAITLPWAIALVVGVFFGNNPLITLTLGLALTAYTLTLGLQKNGEQERSIGSLFGQLTDWEIPPGYSWWVPHPFGKSILQTSTKQREVDRTKKHGLQLERVITRNLNHVDVSYYATYDIVTLVTWASLDAPEKLVSATLDNTVNELATYWDSDGAHSISRQMKAFSEYLMGNEVSVPAHDGFRDFQTIQSSIADLLLKRAGVRLTSVHVDDIKPPQALVDAHQGKASIPTILETEALDVMAIHKRVQELTASLGISNDEALRVVLANRGKIEVIDVRGGGDVSKGAAIHRNNPRRLS